MHLEINKQYLFNTLDKQFIVKYIGIKLVGPTEWMYRNHIVQLTKKEVKEFTINKILYDSNSSWVYPPVFPGLLLHLNDIEIKKYIFETDELLNTL